MRKKEVEFAVSQTIKVLRDCKLDVEEIIIVLGQVIARIGHTIHFKIERPEEAPTERLTPEIIVELASRGVTIGLALMDLGMNLQGNFLQDAKRATKVEREKEKKE